MRVETSETVPGPTGMSTKIQQALDRLDTNKVGRWVYRACRFRLPSVFTNVKAALLSAGSALHIGVRHKFWSNGNERK